MRGFNHSAMVSSAADNTVVIVSYPNYYDQLTEDEDGGIALKYFVQDRLVKLVNEKFIELEQDWVSLPGNPINGLLHVVWMHM